MSTSQTFGSTTTRAAVDLGEGLPVHGLGSGTVPLTGPGVWGRPRHWGEAARVVRRAVERT